MNYPEIDQHILDQWQETTNLLARACSVPVALIMRKNTKSLEVMSAAIHPDSPYIAYETAPLNDQLFCERVIKTQQELYIPNAVMDLDWDHCPEIDLGMISYYGVPVNWPGENTFGTLCILDKVAMHLSEDEKALVVQLAKMIEMSLELILSNQKLEYISMQDGLTKIANRRMFDQTLQAEWGRSIRDQNPFSLILCDIDFFKEYNDHEGHLQGDECLKNVARELALVSKRSADLCARYGGEEFAILLPNTTHKEACRLAEICRKNIYDLEIPHKNSKVSDVISISVGVNTVTPTKEISPLILIEHADKALYSAKENGRNKVVTLKH